MMQPRFCNLLPALSSLQWCSDSSTGLVRDLHLALLIQPNCPGCHSHALPVANQLYNESQNQSQGLSFDVYCVSTAFEDFEYNTKESTKLLLQGTLVGVAKQRLGARAPAVPQMPVALDIVVDKTDASNELVSMALEATKANAREQLAAGLYPPETIERRLNGLGPEVLPEKLATMFYATRAQGTPTWVLHDNNGRVLDSTLGGMSRDDVVAWVDRATNRDVSNT